MIDTSKVDVNEGFNIYRKYIYNIFSIKYVNHHKDLTHIKAVILTSIKIILPKNSLK